MRYLRWSVVNQETSLTKYSTRLANTIDKKYGENPCLESG